MTKIAMILSSHAELGDTGEKTGFYLSEASHPWEVFRDAGYEMTWISPKGGHCPIDGKDTDDATNVEFLEEFGEQGPDTITPAEVDPADYDAIFYVGGHGTMWDFPDNEQLAEIAAAIHGADGVIAAVCHGPAGLLNITDAAGNTLIADKRVAGFTNSEERAQDLADVVPFLLEDALNQAGADHQPGADFEAQVCVDDRIVTGQNPPSAAGVAAAVVAVLTGERIENED